MRHIRPRSAYDVIALISLFLVIGGGTALASYVVSSNSQIGPGTVSGHKPPSGDHPNLIPGSVNQKDLANGAVTPAKLGAVAKFRKKNSVNTSNFQTVLSLGGLTVRYKCVFTGSADVPRMVATSSVKHAAVTLGFNTGTPGFGNAYFTSDQDFNPGDLFDITQNADFGQGNLLYSTPKGTVVSLDYGFLDTPCIAHGLAIER